MSDQQQGGEGVAGLDELDKLGQQAEFEEAAEAAEGEWVPGAQPDPEPAGPTAAEVVTPMVGLLFSVVAARRGEHWELKRQEAEALGGELGAVLDHYWPEQEMPPWVGLAVAGVAVLGPRLAADKAIAAAREQAEAEQRREAEADAG